MWRYVIGIPVGLFALFLSFGFMVEAKEAHMDPSDRLLMYCHAYTNPLDSSADYNRDKAWKLYLKQGGQFRPDTIYCQHFLVSQEMGS
jgi:hypothetical protein